MLLQQASVQALDAWRHGNISESEALNQFDRAAAVYLSSAREAFLIRLRTLEGLRTPRGQQVPETGGPPRRSSRPHRRSAPTSVRLTTWSSW
jgi:hypothetical protein